MGASWLCNRYLTTLESLCVREIPLWSTSDIILRGNAEIKGSSFPPTQTARQLDPHNLVLTSVIGVMYLMLLSNGQLIWGWHVSTQHA